MLLLCCDRGAVGRFVAGALAGLESPDNLTLTPWADRVTGRVMSGHRIPHSQRIAVNLDPVLADAFAAECFGSDRGFNRRRVHRVPLSFVASFTVNSIADVNAFVKRTSTDLGK